jgi:hypothetical protein
MAWSVAQWMIEWMDGWMVDWSEWMSKSFIGTREQPNYLNTGTNG